MAAAQRRVILSMESVFGTLFSILLLGEVVTPRMIVGCTIILVAVVISNLAASSEDEQPTDTPVPEPSGEVSG